MDAYEFGITDFQYVAAGAAVLASGGGGSYEDALGILEEIGDWTGTVTVQAYDGKTPCCVLAVMGSPDAAESMTLTDIECSSVNTLGLFQSATGYELGCLIPVEVGPINSLVPLIAAAMTGMWVVDGDGAGRAVPELPQTTYSGSANLLAAPSVLANDANIDVEPEAVQATTLYATTASQIETLAGGALSAFGSFAGIALWPSNESNSYALTGNYVAGTLSQARALGEYLMTASSAPTTAEVAQQITNITGRAADAVVTNFYITAVTQATTSASLDTGVIRLDNTQDPSQSTETHFIYNLNENLIMYSSLSGTPDVIAPDSICYYSESTGRGFSNAADDLAPYFDEHTGESTGKTVSVIKVQTAPQLYQAEGVVESFAGLLRNIGYAGRMPGN
ncbi:MAG TPA: DUF917 family protein [Rhodocyclaceae bacterium]|nr:DUF917 family protein [Rhodocyclaceae bacterium]